MSFRRRGNGVSLTPETKSTRKGRNRDRGFSLLELVIVVAIMFVVAAMATPTITTAVADYRLKSTASQLVNLLQRARTESVRTNTPLMLRTAVEQGLPVVYLDLPSEGGVVRTDGVRDPGEPMLQVPNSITLQTAGFPGDATAGLTNGLVMFNLMPITATNNAGQFNSRGLPCMSLVGPLGGNATCRNISAANQAQGFVYYLRGDRPFGAAAWAAVTVTPAGRIRALKYANNTYQ
jgi:prepilin-type N-terminal cleavage/methylation domain-containing protein